MRHAGVVIFAVPDVGGHDGAANGGIPALVGGDEVGGAVLVFYLDLAAEGGNLKSVEAEGDAARPPAVGNLRREAVFFAEHVGDVVGELENAATVIGPAGLELVINLAVGRVDADALVVEAQIEHAERGSSDGGALYRLFAVEEGEQGQKTVFGGEVEGLVIENATLFMPRVLVNDRF